MSFLRLKKGVNVGAFTELDYSVLNYEQLLQVNGAGGSSSSGSAPSGPSSGSGYTTGSSNSSSYGGSCSGGSSGSSGGSSSGSSSSSSYGGSCSGGSSSSSGGSSISTLTGAQTGAINNPQFQQGSTGPMNYTGATADTTWCNQATFAVADQTNSGLGSAMYGTHPENTNANTAAQNLQYYANNPNSSIQEVNGSQAQNLANAGYTVVAAYENTSGGSGHLATVAPGYDYNASSGPVLANVGLQSQTGINTSSTVYGSHYTNGEVHYYFNSNQNVN